MIQIIQLSKRYGKKLVLREINALFEQGKVYGIVGENGAGKTTLFRCIAGLETYDGSIVSALPKLKDRLGLLLTDPYFLPRITGMEYIRLLCQARGTDPGAIDQRNVFDLPLNQYAETYSTGMKKKLALTAILLQQNECFILDEPFNGVDIQSNMLITGIIHQLKALGKTVLIASHIFSTLHDTCDEIFWLENGSFTHHVLPESFDALEQEMKSRVVGRRVDQLGLK